MAHETEQQRAALLEEFDAQVRRAARPDDPGARIEVADGVVRQVGPADGWNGVVHTDLRGLDAEQVVERECAYFRALGRQFEWKHYSHDCPADLPELLRAAGLRPGEAESVVVAPTEVAAVEAPPLPEGVTVRQAGIADVAAVCAVHEEAFAQPMPGLAAQLTAQLAATAGGFESEVLVLMALAAGRPVSAARLELPAAGRFAGLWGGGTVPGWRGRGLYRALVAERAAVAAERGYTYVHVDASPQSRPILERLGFVRLTSTTPYTSGS